MTVKEQWQNKKHSFFNHKDCEAFPCHVTDDEENFNCLFCYCPLYVMGNNCGGNFTLTTRGIMDCSNCMFPHERENYGYILKKCKDICNMIKHEPEA